MIYNFEYQIKSLLIFHDRFLKSRKLRAVRPDILASHGTIPVPSAAESVFPTDVESFMEITTVFWISILSKQSSITLEVRGLVDIDRLLVSLR